MQTKPSRFESAICLFHKDENAYLDEFVAYHLALGFRHVFIIDNLSAVSPTLTLDARLRPFVTVRYFDRVERRHKHGRAFSFFCRTLGDRADWVAFIDTDEFIVLKRHQDIDAFLAEYHDCAAVGVNTRAFGDSGWQTRPAGLQTEAFVRAAASDFRQNQQVKCIVQMRFLERASLNPHWFEYREGHSAVNERKIAYEGAVSPFSNAKIQINHYWTRSREEFVDKTMRGGGNGLERKIQMYDQFQRHANAVEDRSIAPHVAAMKRFLAALGGPAGVLDPADAPAPGPSGEVEADLMASIAFAQACDEGECAALLAERLAAHRGEAASPPGRPARPTLESGAAARGGLTQN